MFAGLLRMALALLPLTVALVARGTAMGHRAVIRTKPGESPAEAKLILLGTFRIYTWAMALTALIWLVRITGALPQDEHALRMATAVGTIITLSLSGPIYWRLGYDWRMSLMIIGHQSILFPLTEYGALCEDIRRAAPETAAAD